MSVFTESDPQTDMAALFKTTTELAETETLDVQSAVMKDSQPSSAEVLVVAEGKKILSIKPYLDEYRQAPERREGTATLTQLESFIDHVNRFKDADSAVFAAVENAADSKLVAVLDYHRQTAEGAPRFGRHRALYRFPVSDEWNAWTKPRQPMAMAEFAEFLEDRVVDVIDPATIEDKSPTLAEAKMLGITLGSPQALLEVSRGLTINVKSGVTAAQRLSSGETQISFKEEHDAASKDGTKALAIPGGFAIGIPVFRGGAPYRLLVRLRYRLEGASIRWFFVISRAEKTWQTAVQESCVKAKDGTGLPLFYGTPEG